MTEDPTKIAYLAGLFDGEGSIYGGVDPRTGLHITCIMGPPEALKLFHEAFGGSLKLYRPTGNQKTAAWRWSLHGAIKQEAFLAKVFPWLIIKKAQAELALQYVQTVRKKGSSLTPTKEVIELRTLIIRSLSELNCKKGRNSSRKPVKEGD